MDEAVVTISGLELLLATPGRFTDLDGVRIHYKVLGEGRRTVVLVHGGGCDLTFWDLQVPALAGAGRVVLLDLPGHGGSDKPEDLRYSMKLHGAAVNRVLEAENIEAAVVVGHSLGVPALREFYRAWPDKVDGFVAIDGVLIYSDPGWLFNAVVRLLNTWLYRYLWPYLVNGYTGEMTPPDGRGKVNDAMKNAPRYIARSFFAEMLHEETAYDDAIAAPLLAIYAEHPRWTAEVLNRVRSISDRTTLVVMPAVSHFLMLDKPDETNRLLADFVRECTPAGR